MASGVSRAGAMDLHALFTLNTMLGNDPGCAAIELALSGGEIEFGSSAIFAIGGATTGLTLSGREVPLWQAHHAGRGDVLVVAPPRDGRFIYIAFAGGVDVPPMLKSRSTYLPAMFGGRDGRRLRNGDTLDLLEATRKQRHQVSDQLPEALRPPLSVTIIRYIPRDESDLDSEFILSGASDRTGYRLESASPLSGKSILSQPVCPGVIQIPPDGHPIILMADAPTIGGYHVAGVVISADLGPLAQRTPGEAIAFQRATVSEAHKLLASASEKLESVREWRLA